MNNPYYIDMIAREHYKDLRREANMYRLGGQVPRKWHTIGLLSRIGGHFRAFLKRRQQQAPSTPCAVAPC